MRLYTKNQLEKIYDILIENFNAKPSLKFNFIFLNSIKCFPIELDIKTFGTNLKIRREFLHFYIHYNQYLNSKENIKIIKKVNNLLKEI